MRELFAEDPGRFEAFSLGLGDLFLDYSKNRITAETITLLLALARERGVSDLRGGNNNAPTRIMMNPSTMVGGYANWTYFLNYWGTSPSERDCAVFIRKKPMEKDGRKVIYQERDLELGA